MLSKVELFNARNASNPISAGLEIKVKSVGSYEDTDKDGKPVITPDEELNWIKDK